MNGLIAIALALLSAGVLAGTVDSEKRWVRAVGLLCALGMLAGAVVAT